MSLLYDSYLMMMEYSLQSARESIRATKCRSAFHRLIAGQWPTPTNKKVVGPFYYKGCNSSLRTSINYVRRYNSPTYTSLIVLYTTSNSFIDQTCTTLSRRFTCHLYNSIKYQASYKKQTKYHINMNSYSNYEHLYHRYSPIYHHTLWEQGFCFFIGRFFLECVIECLNLQCSPLHTRAFICVCHSLLYSKKLESNVLIDRGLKIYNSLRYKGGPCV